jgi:MraZ protein
MSLFLSTHFKKIDKKGRVSVPSSFRAILNKKGESEMVAYASIKNNCIEACGVDRLEQICESIEDLDPYSDEHDAFATMMLGGASQLSFDNEGRVMLPKDLTGQFNIENEVYFVGKGKVFEIWNPQEFENHMKKAREVATNNRNMLKTTTISK